MLILALFCLAGIFLSMFIHAQPPVQLMSDDAQEWADMMRFDFLTADDVDDSHLPRVGQTDHLQMLEVKLVGNTPMVKIWDYSRKRMFSSFIPRHFIFPMIVDTPWGKQDITWRTNEPEYVLGYEGVEFVLMWLKSVPCPGACEKIWRKKKELYLRPKVHVCKPSREADTPNYNVVQLPKLMEAV